MKSIMLLSLSLSLSAAAAPSLTSVTAAQDWPWSQKVHIDYTLEADAPCDLEVSATWRGCGAPLRLMRANGLSGLTFGVASGSGTLTWDPHAAGLTNALPGLKFTVTPVLVSSRTYLVLDLVSGEHEYLSDVPSGGWTEEYKTTKLVFRRIPAGTFQMGVPQAHKEFIGGKWDEREGVHSVTISHDYYLAIFLLTQAQYAAINNKAVSDETTKLQPYRDTYVNLRDRNKQPGEIDNWPLTGHAVEKSTPIGLLRAKFGSEFLFDLPTEAQWERAARAGSSGIWYSIDGYPNGGTPDELGTWGNDKCRAFLDAIGKWEGSSVAADVGQCTPNAWGLYDLIGLNMEWCLDQWTFDTSALPDSTDPLGSAVTTKPSQRVLRGGCSTAINMSVVIGKRNNGITGAKYGVRLAVHLVPLVD